MHWKEPIDQKYPDTPIEATSNPETIDISTTCDNPIKAVARDIIWLEKLCIQAFDCFNNTTAGQSSSQQRITCNEFRKKIPAPNTRLPYDQILNRFHLDVTERIIIITALAPYFSPGTLSVLTLKNPITNQPFSEVGGILVNDQRVFMPTIDTIRFLNTDNNIENSYFTDQYFSNTSRLLKLNIITLEQPERTKLWNKSIVSPTAEFLATIKGEKYTPSYNNNFPASRISTRLDWTDLVLPFETNKALSELSIWLKHSHKILQHPQLGRFIKPGFRSLFYGPPGTGKTLTASLLGKKHNLDVYRIDLSMVVSKWVGETEKNLKGIFDQAENKNWILFFDEADSLFGKRTQTKSANDRHANQEVAYLLQRIEDFPGLVILATNLKDNIDEAFSRRFQSMVYFPNPDAESRYTLWKNSMPSDYILEDGLELYDIAQNYEVTGGIIINVIRYCILMAIHENRKTILAEDLETGIQKELRKNGRIIA